MQFMLYLPAGFEIGKILFVKKLSVRRIFSIWMENICLFSLFSIYFEEIPCPISNQGISTTKNGQTRLIRRGK